MKQLLNLTQRNRSSYAASSDKAIVLLVHKIKMQSQSIKQAHHTTTSSNFLYLYSNLEPDRTRIKGLFAQM